MTGSEDSGVGDVSAEENLEGAMSEEEDGPCRRKCVTCGTLVPAAICFE